MPSPLHDPSKTLKRATGSVYEDDFEQVVCVLGNRDPGLISDVLRTLLHHFRVFCDEQQLLPYVHNRTTPDKLRRFLTLGKFVIEPRELVRVHDTEHCSDKRA